MFITETQIRIDYALTDQMGVVYHGHYAQFYEIGRTEAIRQIGFTYKGIEELGIIMPVVEINSRFLRPAKYDDLITVKTTLKEIPTNFKIVFHAEIFNEQDELLNTGEVTLFFVDAKNRNGVTCRRCCGRSWFTILPQTPKGALEKNTSEGIYFKIIEILFTKTKLLK